MKTWCVYLHGELVRTVYFSSGMSQPAVYRALVEHDGYSPAAEWDRAARALRAGARSADASAVLYQADADAGAVARGGA